MKKKDLTLLYSLTLITYWGAYGCFSFAAAYMLKLGIPATVVGTMVAAPGLLSCFLQPFLASYADRAKKPVLIKLLVTLGSCSVTLFAVQLIPGLPIYLAGILYAMGLLFTDAMVPLVNAVYVEYTRSGYPINYGVSRGCGSVSSAAGMLISGFLMAKLGMTWMLVFYLSFYLVTLIFLMNFPKLKSRGKANEAVSTSDEATEVAVTEAASTGTAENLTVSETSEVSTETAPESCSIPVFFRKYKWYCISLLGFMLFAMFLSMIESYMIAIMERLGGDSSHVGVALFISTIAGTPVVFFFTRIRKRVHDLNLLRISAIMFLIRSVLTLFAPNILTIYLIQTMHICSYSFMAPTQVYYAGAKVNAADMVKGQAFISASWALGCSFGNFIGGQLLPFGVRTLLMSGILMTACGSIVLFLTISKKDKAVTDTAEIL